MSTTLIFILVFYTSYAITALARSLYWAYLWQLKEYRTDRMLDFLGTRTGRSAVWNVRSIGELFFIGVFTVVYTLGFGEDPVGITLPFLLFAAFVVLEVLLFLKNRVRPQWTMKALLITVATVTVQLFVPLLLQLGIQQTIATYQLLLLFPLLLFLSPLISGAFVLLLRPATTAKKQQIIAQAKEKVERIDPIVIAITGSYGKSSTKEFLNTILQQKFRVFATPKNVNVDIGIAKTILASMEENTEVAVIEMGAYREGEIEASCHIVSPIVGVITAIANQHYSLFGGTEQIKNAKSEIIQSLPPSGLALLNQDSMACVQVADRTRAQKKFFSAEEVANIHATDVVVTPESVTFMLNIGNSARQVSTKLHGKQVIPSILAAAGVADHLGMSIEEIASGIGQLQPIDANMHLKRGRGGMVVIDDHYSSNPDGFLAALDYLNVFEPDRRKVVITRGMDELGDQADSEHRAIGARIAEVADTLVITKKDFAKPLADAAKQGGMTTDSIIVSERPRKLVADVLSDLTPNDVVLIENRIHPLLIEYLLKR